MELLAAIGLLVLAAIAGLRFKSALHPAFVMSVTWAAALLGVFLAGDLFYPLSSEGVLVYTAGATSFLLGSCVIKPRTRSPFRAVSWRLDTNNSPVKFVKTFILSSVVIVPLYWQHINAQARSYGSDFWFGVRTQAVSAGNFDYRDGYLPWDTILYSNFSTLAGIVGLISIREHACRRLSGRLMVATLAVAGVSQLFTGAAAGFAYLFIGGFAVHSIVVQRVKLRFLGTVAILFLTGFLIVGTVLKKGSLRPDASLSDNVSAAGELVSLYALGGLVAGDQVIQNPSLIPSAWSIWRVFALTANKFGANIPVTSLHADYTAVSPTLNTNVYTIYFSYFPDVGFFGTVIILFGLGSLITQTYQYAVAGSTIAVILYGPLLNGVVLSIFNEQYFLALNSLAKTLVVVWLVYHVPQYFVRRAQLLRNQTNGVLASLDRKQVA